MLGEFSTFTSVRVSNCEASIPGGKQFILCSAIKCWICLSAAVKVGKLRSENGEASWVRVGWGGWVWQTWESCPAANKLVSTLTLIHRIGEYVWVTSLSFQLFKTPWMTCVSFRWLSLCSTLAQRRITVLCVLLRKTRGWRESGPITLPAKHSNYTTLAHGVFTVRLGFPHKKSLFVSL